MRNYLLIDGTDSRTFGVYISGSGTFNSPTRALNMIQVPGRNGDLIGPATRLQNGTLTYPASFIWQNFDANLAAFRGFLLSSATYRRIVDTYHPDEYRMGVFRGPLTVTPTKALHAGQFDLSFEVMPQRFLVSGETVITLTGSRLVTNPTLFPSKPLLRVYGAGAIGINSTTITISQADVYTDIDCDLGMAYKGAVSKNAYVSLSSVDFPVLRAGSNTIAIGTGITQVEITPRWWKV